MANIKFKSIPIYWKEEKNGNKSNTLRTLDTDSRFRLLRHYESIIDSCELKIEIVNTQTNESFIRTVSNIFFTDKKQVLISWRHIEESLK